MATARKTTATAETKEALNTNADLRMVALVSQKGGAGKSHTTMLLAYLYETFGVDFGRYEGDESGGVFSRAHGLKDANGKLLSADKQNPKDGVLLYDITDIKNEAEVDAAFDDTFDFGATRNALPGGRTFTDSFKSPHKVNLHDIKGGTLQSLTRLVDNGNGVDGLLRLADEAKRRLTLVHVIDADRTSAVSVGMYLDLFGDRADHIALVNQKTQKAPKAAPFWFGFKRPDGVREGGVARQELGEMVGFKEDGRTPVTEVLMPGLDEYIATRIRAWGMTFKQAATSDWFTHTEQAIIETYLNDATKSIMSVRHLLGF